MTGPFSPYDLKALKEIKLFKHPPSKLPAFLSFVGEAAEYASDTFNSAADYAMDSAVGRTINEAVLGVTSICMDAASWSVRTEAIFAEYRSKQYSINGLQDIQACHLSDVDKVVGYLGAKYKVAAGTTGAGFGALGLPGIPASIAALVGLSLRAIGEYATYYGCDLDLQSERMFALTVLSLASGASGAAKQALLAQVATAQTLAAKKATYKVLEQQAVVRAMQQLARSLGIRLTKAKLAQILPVAGAAVGGGFDAWFLANVTEAAFLLYRERFLIHKYGAEPVLAETT